MTLRLTRLSHGGGCGCKLDPTLLDTILAGLPNQLRDPAMIVGLETKDDAIVYRLDDDKAVVATTDFFMPVVDDPYDFGAIAATNAISDIYAVGGQPLFALAVLGMPAGKLPADVIGRILAGGSDIAAKAGIMVGGGHSIDTPEPIYGLAVVGIVHPDRVKRNNTAKAGDMLILGKSLGVGILCAAFKQGKLTDEGYHELIETTTRLNGIGAALGEMGGVHAMTDVTGFGLLGHMSELCEGSQVAARLYLPNIPFLPAAVPLAQSGISTGAGTRNRQAFGDNVMLPEGLADWQRNMLFDPQTSGGLLVAVAPNEAETVLEMFRNQGHATATVIGRLEEGAPTIRVGC